MALSDYDSMVLNEKGEPCDGSFTSPLGVRVEFYKNWLYVSDENAWREGGSYIKPTVMEIQEGDLTYLDVHIIAFRGPQNGVFALVHSSHYDNGEDGSKDYSMPPTITGMIGCSVVAYSGNEYVGVSEESTKWWNNKLRETKSEPWYSKTWGAFFDDSILEKDDFEITEVEYHEYPVIDCPNCFREIDWDKAVRFNQGDALFARHEGFGIPATKPGEHKTPLIEKKLDEIFPRGE